MIRRISRQRPPSARLVAIALVAVTWHAAPPSGLGVSTLSLAAPPNWLGVSAMPQDRLQRAGVHSLGRLGGAGGHSSLSALGPARLTPPGFAFAQELPDLVVEDVDTSGLASDPQTLQVAGDLQVTVRNRGTVRTATDFAVLPFEDRDANGLLTPGADPIMGHATVQPLAGGASAVVTIPLLATLAYRDSRLHAFVDVTGKIPEIDENNNVGAEITACHPRKSASASPADARLEWEWRGGSTMPRFDQVMMAPAVVDLDGDGVPEVVFASFQDNTYREDGLLRAIGGADGREVFTVTDREWRVNPSSSLAVGDIDMDGRPEILAVAETRDRLLAFEHDGTPKWRGPEVAGEGRQWGSIYLGGPALGDLDGDGVPEIVVSAAALRGDGTVLWDSGDGLAADTGLLPLIADLDLDGEPEVVAGKVALNSRGKPIWPTNELPPGFNAVANFDADPEAEVVLVAAGDVYLLEHSGDVKWGPVPLPGRAERNVGGPPTVADVTGNGSPEIGVAGGVAYSVFTADGELLWSAPTDDSSSSRSSGTVFDLDANGVPEVIYGDEHNLRIYNGPDGRQLWSVESTSSTTYELPVVVDVDADGRTEIVEISNNTWSVGTNGIQVYGGGGEGWAWTRPVWNQHNYHVTNVADDGTIPSPELPSWRSVAGANTYRVNAARDAAGELLDVSAGWIRQDPPVEGSVRLWVRIGNPGAGPVPADTKVAFYSSSQMMGVISIGEDLRPGTWTDVSLTVDFAHLGDGFIRVVADDDGAGVGVLEECDEENNVHVIGGGLPTREPTPTNVVSLTPATPTRTASATVSPTATSGTSATPPTATSTTGPTNSPTFGTPATATGTTGPTVSSTTTRGTPDGGDGVTIYVPFAASR